MEFLLDYASFSAKLATVLITLGLLVLAVVLLLASRRRRSAAPEVEVTRLNHHYDDLKAAMEGHVLDPKALKKAAAVAKKARKQQARDNVDRRRVYVCHFDGDIRASAVESLREELTAILTIARAEDEVVVVLESGGGTIHGYGLAASQLMRVRDRDLALTVAVDRIAASGGYMMACVANRIIAAPFAIIGSIGVVAQLPNFNRLLKRNDIDFEQITAGEYKRTLSMFGENSEEGRQKLRDELEDAHHLFKDFVSRFRPALDIEAIATGETWFGTRALDQGLVDELRTSDDYLYAAAGDADVFRVEIQRRKHWAEKIMDRASVLTRWAAP